MTDNSVEKNTEKKVNQQNIPKLRFPEFSDEWSELKLGDILTFYSTNSFSRAKLNYDNGTVKNIHYGDIHTKYSSILSLSGNSEVPFINTDVDLSRIKEDQYLKNGDLIIADASEDYADIGKAIEVTDIDDEKVLAGLHTILARDEKGITVDGFKAYLFAVDTFKTKLKVIANGISVLGISKNNISKLNVNFPSKKEQQKIVDFISLTEKRIELLGKKLQDLQEFKKYLLQNIFAQKLRFENYDEEWIEYSLGEIGTTYGGLSGLTKNDFNKGNSFFIPYKNVFDNNIIDTTFLEPVELNNKHQNQVQKGDLFFTGSSETPEEVGMVSVLTEELTKCYLNSFCFGYRLKEPSNFNSEFLAYYLRSPLLRNKIKILAQGSTRFNISKKELMKLRFDIPNYNEQNKIVNLLRALNLRLSNTKKQILLMEDFKKGLLQSLFI